MSEQVRVGIIGTSWWADMMHLPSLKSHSRAQIVAICGRNRDRADEMAGKYEIRHVFTNHREMIAQADLDALVIATPDGLHHAPAMAALAGGARSSRLGPRAGRPGAGTGRVRRAGGRLRLRLRALKARFLPVWHALC